MVGEIMFGSMKVLLTGGTGFLGEYLLAELLDRGHQVWAMYRSEHRKLNTIRFLCSLGLPLSANSLHWFRGELLDIADQWEAWCQEYEGLAEVDTLIHCAGSTRFHLDEYGEPVKTNVGGARVLRKLKEKHPLKVHLVSTAYVCGRIDGQVVYEVNHPRGDFLNVYEESKWEAEQLWTGEATILRPSIIVGDSDTGRCTSFTGWYILLQAVHLLDRLMGENRNSYRHNLQIHIPSDASASTNIIPVNWVAKAAVRIIENPRNHNKIFHLTHPHPPSHQWTLEQSCKRFNIGGIRFVGTNGLFTPPRNVIERLVWRQIQSIALYFSNDPKFDRANTENALPDLPVPDINEAFFHRLINYAIEQSWGQAQD